MPWNSPFEKGNSKILSKMRENQVNSALGLGVGVKGAHRHSVPMRFLGSVEPRVTVSPQWVVSDSEALGVGSPVSLRALEMWLLPYSSLPWGWPPIILASGQRENGSHRVITLLITLSTSCLGTLLVEPPSQPQLLLLNSTHFIYHFLKVILAPTFLFNWMCVRVHIFLDPNYLQS